MPVSSVEALELATSPPNCVQSAAEACGLTLRLALAATPRMSTRPRAFHRSRSPQVALPQSKPQQTIRFISGQIPEQGLFRGVVTKREGCIAYARVRGNVANRYPLKAEWASLSSTQGCGRS